MPYEEAQRAKNGKTQASYYQEALSESVKFRKDYMNRKGVIKAEEMPWEDAPQGRIKHVINEKMNTRECVMDMYIQSLPAGGRSGKHRHMSEEVFFVLEGRGYDLHWDLKFDCADKFYWDWESEPRKFEWEQGDVIYIPPYTTHQHFNADHDEEARFISTTSRLVKALGFNWLEQVDNAPGL